LNININYIKKRFLDSKETIFESHVKGKPFNIQISAYILLLNNISQPSFLNSVYKMTREIAIYQTAPNLICEKCLQPFIVS